MFEEAFESFDRNGIFWGKFCNVDGNKTRLLNDLTARKMYKNMERVIANLLERIRIFYII